MWGCVGAPAHTLCFCGVGWSEFFCLIGQNRSSDQRSGIIFISPNKKCWLKFSFSKNSRGPKYKYFLVRIGIKLPFFYIRIHADIFFERRWTIIALPIFSKLGMNVHLCPRTLIIKKKCRKNIFGSYFTILELFKIGLILSIWLYS